LVRGFGDEDVGDEDYVTPLFLYAKEEFEGL